MYPSWISRSLCSAGTVRCIKPFAQSRNETNSSWVNGADKSGFILQICASGAAVQARFVCHNQTDPLPLSERGGPNTAQIDVVLSVPVLHPALPVDFFHTVNFPANFTCKRKPDIIMASDSRRNGLTTAPASKALWPSVGLTSSWPTQPELRHERPRHAVRAGAVSVLRSRGHKQKPPRFPSTARRCVAFAWRYAASSGART
jgi:hypothetical protein